MERLPLLRAVWRGRAAIRAGDGVVLVGSAPPQGSVIAASAWDAPMHGMPVPSAPATTWEEILHRAGADDKLLLLQGAQEPAETQPPRGHRAIGVVYDPAY